MTPSPLRPTQSAPSTAPSASKSRSATRWTLNGLAVGIIVFGWLGAAEMSKAVALPGNPWMWAAAYDCIALAALFVAPSIRRGGAR